MYTLLPILAAAAALGFVGTFIDADWGLPLLLTGVLGTAIYGIGVNYLRHELGLPFWANLLISPFFYGIWAMVRFRLGRLDCRQR